MGRLIEFVPYPVVLGFTAGIAVVIAVLQIPDFLGLETDKLGEHFLGNVGHIATAIPTLRPLEFAVGAFTLAVMLVWPKLRTPVPAPLVGLIAGALAAWGLDMAFSGPDTAAGIETIASRFTWEAGGISGSGIPPIAPDFNVPWHLPGPDGQPITLDFALIQALMGPAFAIAMLGAIESLLCAVISDGQTKTRHDPNAELIGQGLGNLVAPLFGGITATAAIARTATSIRSGARSPIAAIAHAGIVLLSVLLLTDLLGRVPMASLAALLLIVAWNMSEARRFLYILCTAPAGDVAVLITCFGLTVVFDMVIAVAVGIGLAGMLFIRRMALLTETKLVSTAGHAKDSAFPGGTAVYDINGPLFFGAAERALTSLNQVDSRIRTLVIDMSDVPSIDATAIVALQSMISEMQRKGIALVLVGLQPRIIVKLRRAGIRKAAGSLAYRTNLAHAESVVAHWEQLRAETVTV
nr:SulP family inorganic anion transporter [Kordiimonas gwangyangensis]